MKWIFNHSVLLILFSLIVLPGCMPFMYYSPQVCNPGERYVGVSMLGYYVNFQESFNTAWYTRWGLPYGFDTGIELQFFLFVPSTISASIRKQFDFNNELINSITLGLSYGKCIQEQTMITLSILSKNLGLTGGISKLSVGDGFFSISTVTSPYTVNNLFLQISYDADDKSFGNFHVMPYLYYSYSMKKDNWENPWYFNSFTNKSDFMSFHSIGIGFSFYRVTK